MGAYGRLFLGCAISLSSTAVMSRMLEERGELGSSHGTVMLGILVVQDLSLVFLALLLPALATVASDGPRALTGIGFSLVRAFLLVAISIVVGKGLIATPAVFALRSASTVAPRCKRGSASRRLASSRLCSRRWAHKRSSSRTKVTAVTLSAALLTLRMAPAVFASAVPIYTRLSTIPGLARRMQRQQERRSRARSRTRGRAYRC